MTTRRPSFVSPRISTSPVLTLAKFLPRRGMLATAHGCPTGRVSRVCASVLLAARTLPLHTTQSERSPTVKAARREENHVRAGALPSSVPKPHESSPGSLGNPGRLRTRLGERPVGRVPSGGVPSLNSPPLGGDLDATGTGIRTPGSGTGTGRRKKKRVRWDFFWGWGRR